MTTTHDLDQRRHEALKTIERTELAFKAALIAAAVVEAAGLIGFLWFMDFGDRLNKLLLMHAIFVYGTLSIGLVALGIFLRNSTLRVLSAIELLVPTRGNP